MRQLLLLALLLPFALANAQTRYQFGDNPRWADPGFDDSAWREAADGAIATPPFQSSGYLWIRYRVPVRIESSAPLALRLASPPSFRRLPSETWVNGQRVASIGAFPPDLALVSRFHPQVFHLPPSLVPAGSMAVVAQRCWFPPVQRDLTSARSVAIAEREPLQLRERLASLEAEYRTVPSKVLYWVSVAFGVLLLLVYRLLRGGKELLWFGSYLVASGIYEVVQLLRGPGDVRTLSEGLWDNLANLIVYGILFHFFLWTAFRLERIWPLLASFFSTALGWFLLTFPVLITEPYGWLKWPFVNPPNVWLVSNGVLAWIGLSQAFGSGRSSTALDRSLGLAVAVAAAMFTAGNYGLAESLPSAGFSIAQLFMVTAMAMALLHRAWRTVQTQRELESDLDAARQIQTALLNVAHPDIRAFSVDVISEPARQVGGDFHWFLGSSIDGSLLVLVGDVSGKGLKAAMTVSLAMGILSIEKSKSPAAILAKLNEGLTGRTPGFATCCCARFDPDGTVTVANAGHPAPYVDGRELQLESGLPLGLIQHVVYEESFVKGDRFTFVSDGVVEAENAQRELFGFDRTREISTKPAQEIAEAAKAWGQNDDITVVTVRRSA